MAYLLAICPVCGCEWNRLEPIPEFDVLRATTAVRYPLNCPRCGCCGFTFSIMKRSYADYMATRKCEIDEHPEWGIKYF